MATDSQQQLAVAQSGDLPSSGNLALAMNPLPMKFRIGPPQNEYVYTHMFDGCWKCKRPASGRPSNPGNTLWIYQVDGCTVAVHAPGTAATRDAVTAGDPVFNCHDPSVLHAGWHEWDGWDDRSRDWEALGQFETAHL